jgi:hypothetical protein
MPVSEEVVPAAEWETPPDIEAPWRGIWLAAVAELRRLGSWSEPLRPLLDSYVIALRTAAEHRLLAERKPVERNRESGLSHMHAGFPSADRELRRAVLIANELGLTPKARKALEAGSKEAADAPQNPFDALDELAPLRSQRAQAHQPA